MSRHIVDKFIVEKEVDETWFGDLDLSNNIFTGVDLRDLVGHKLGQFEGIAGEPAGQTIADWRSNHPGLPGRNIRLAAGL